jgi:hypothetical protein
VTLATIGNREDQNKPTIRKQGTPQQDSVKQILMRKSSRNNFYIAASENGKPEVGFQRKRELSNF